MTRGTFWLITDDKIYSSTEFNGGMEIDSEIGERGWFALKNTDNLEQFKSFIEQINKKYFEYEENLVYEESNIFSNPFVSDYDYIKNISSFTYPIKCKNETIELKPQESLATYFRTPINLGKNPEKIKNIIKENFTIHEYNSAFELETWTDGGVNYCFDFDGEIAENIFNIIREFENYDIDEEIDLHRQDREYKEAFTITESLEDFQRFSSMLQDTIKKLEEVMHNA